MGTGSDIAGEIVEIGHGVAKFQKGDKIVAMLGGLAEYVVVREDMMVIKPYEVSAIEYAGLGTSALIAYQCLITAGVKLDKTGPPMNVLITAASGGVGHYAVQLSKLGNTHVTPICGACNAAFVRSLWADEILDYKTPEGKALISPSWRKYDAVVHCTTGVNWSTFNNVLISKERVVDITLSPSALATFTMKKLTCSKK
ncbi:quinone-oxidoreductase homolog, chloroplastic-like [Apium graveolens]|uniref:quinone-oxidoreductase homolog, chloroplastic-like n=1 Tax=Apium graveolens TaxID=4045 RepID=UPI003D797F40